MDQTSHIYLSKRSKEKLQKFLDKSHFQGKQSKAMEHILDLALKQLDQFEQIENRNAGLERQILELTEKFEWYSKQALKASVVQLIHIKNNDILQPQAKKMLEAVNKKYEQIENGKTQERKRIIE